MSSYKDPQKQKEYMNALMKQRYATRRKRAIEKLGGKCKHCSGTQKLQFDHIDPKTKALSTSRMTSCSEEKFWAEIKKCQLLCDPCHRIKTTKERGKQPARGTHGTLSSYRYCRCSLCKEAKSKHSKEMNRKKKRERLQQKSGVVTQQAERRTFTPEDEGSNPSGPTKGS